MESDITESDITEDSDITESDITKMSQTPYKGDAKTAENEGECRFWLIGL